MTSEELRAELKRRGWTQTALAKRLGVGMSAVNRWCQGTSPVPNTVAAYLRAVELESERQGITGDELHAELKRRGWTQTELARRLGVPQETVSRWRHDKHAIHPAVAAYLRDVPREPEIAGEQAAQALPATDMQAEIVALTERLRAAERKVVDKGEEIAWLRSQLLAALAARGGAA